MGISFTVLLGYFALFPFHHPVEQRFCLILRRQLLLRLGPSCCLLLNSSLDLSPCCTMTVDGWRLWKRSSILDGYPHSSRRDRNADVTEYIILNAQREEISTLEQLTVFLLQALVKMGASRARRISVDRLQINGKPRSDSSSAYLYWWSKLWLIDISRHVYVNHEAILLECSPVDTGKMVVQQLIMQKCI